MDKGARAVLWCAAVLILLPSPAPSRADDELRFFRIGTAATTGTYFQLGGMLANVISKPPGSRDCDQGGSCGVPGLVAVAQATPGSDWNAAEVWAGQLESALVQADIAHWAYAGTWPATPSCEAPAPVAAPAAAPVAPAAEQQNQAAQQNPKVS